MFALALCPPLSSTEDRAGLSFFRMQPIKSRFAPLLVVVVEGGPPLHSVSILEAAAGSGTHA